MATTPRDFSYDGTFEGLLCVILKCISLRVMPHSIKPYHMIINSPYEDKYSYIRSNYNLADKLYQHLGKVSSVENQQIASDCFLTCLPDMEKDVFLFVCKSLKYGAYIAEDYKDESVARIQAAIRNLYREEQAYFANLDFKEIDNVSASIINPMNCVLPIMKFDLVHKYKDKDMIVMDKRHRKVFVKNKYIEEVFDIRMIQQEVINTETDLVKHIYPYFVCEFRPNITYNADSLIKLWHIAG